MEKSLKCTTTQRIPNSKALTNVLEDKVPTIKK